MKENPVSKFVVEHLKALSIVFFMMLAVFIILIFLNNDIVDKPSLARTDKAILEPFGSGEGEPSTKPREMWRLIGPLKTDGRFGLFDEIGEGVEMLRHSNIKVGDQLLFNIPGFSVPLLGEIERVYGDSISASYGGVLRIPQSTLIFLITESEREVYGTINTPKGVFELRGIDETVKIFSRSDIERITGKTL